MKERSMNPKNGVGFSCMGDKRRAILAESVRGFMRKWQ